MWPLAFSSPPRATLLVYLALATVLVWMLLSYLRLRHVPGPFLASLTDLFRLFWVYKGNAGDKHTSLHRKYGPLVRFGPNMVSVSAPSEIGVIYDIHGTFPKSNFYRALSFYVKGRAIPGLFATQDRRIHKLLRKPIAGIYSMTNLVSYEPMVDSTIRCFFEQLDERFVKTSQVCALDVWLQMFAFDVIGSITFSKRLGFLEKGQDIDGIMQNSWRYFKVASLISQMPWLDYIWIKNPILQRLRRAKINPIVAFASARRKERAIEAEKGGNTVNIDDEKNSQKSDNKDFLTRFLEVESRDPETPPWAVSAWSTSNITAGSDTTAILLRTIFYNLLKHPESLAKLRHELTTEPGLDTQLVTWKQSLNLTYLGACIKEAGRLHPPFALPYERVVPAEGATICGKFLPGGTVVGMCPWATHRDYSTFGTDSDFWRPERWIEVNEAKRRQMESALLTFGAGNRSCIGKHISYLEISKLVPSLVREFDVRFTPFPLSPRLLCPFPTSFPPILRFVPLETVLARVDDRCLRQIEFADGVGSDWKVENRWFAKQTGLNVRLKRRSIHDARLWSS